MKIKAKKLWSARKAGLVIGGSLMVGLLTGIGGPALAGTATGATGTHTTYGKTYYAYARVMTSPGKAEASSWISPSGTTAPAGWVGANGRLFRDSGAMFAESGFGYNSITLNSGSWYTNTTGYYSITGTFYSWGVVRSWNGGGYSSYYTFKSPYQTS